MPPACNCTFKSIDTELKHHPTDMFLFSEGLFKQAIQVLGKQPDVAKLHKQFMINAGFVDVQEKIVHIPQNSWPVDKKKRECVAP